MLRLLASIILFLALAVLRCGPLSAQEAGPKLALLIGNSDYVRSVGALQQSPADVETMKQALARIGFSDITVLSNVKTREELETAVGAFDAKLAAAGDKAISLFYYAGHGAADAGGANYIIPTGVGSLNPALLWDRSYRLDTLVQKLGQHGGSHIVVFDACRNELNLPSDAAAAKSFSLVTRDALPPGVLIAFSTGEGTVAGDSGLYAKTLAEEIVKSNRLAAEVFLRVTNRLATATEGRQQPWYNNNLTGEVYLAGKQPLSGTETAAAGDELTAEPAGKQTLVFVADNVEVHRGLDWKSGLVEVRGKGSIHIAKRPDEILLIRKGDRTWVTYDSDWGQAYVDTKDVSVE